MDFRSLGNPEHKSSEAGGNDATNSSDLTGYRLLAAVRLLLRNPVRLRPGPWYGARSAADDRQVGGLCSVA